MLHWVGSSAYWGAFRGFLHGWWRSSSLAVGVNGYPSQVV